MTALGIVGGIAPESTIDYYRRLIAAYRARSGGDNPHLLINSIDVNHLLALAGAGQLDAMADYLSEAVAALARAGASVALFASNTPHLVFDEVQRRSPIRLISIVEAAGAAAKAMGLCQVGLLGTRFTMQAAFYPAVFVRHGIAVVPPAADEQELVHTRLCGRAGRGRVQRSDAQTNIGSNRAHGPPRPSRWRDPGRHRVTAVAANQHHSRRADA